MFRRFASVLAAVVLGLVPVIAVASPASAIPVPPPGPDKYRFRVLEHNIAGGANFRGEPQALDYVNEQIANENFPVDAVLLTEVCASQRDDFKEAHPGWHVYFSVMINDQGTCSDPDTDNKRQGQLLASPHPLTDVENDHLGYPDEGEDGDPRTKYFKLLCADVDVPGFAADEFRACVTHLHAFPRGKEARKQQLRKIKTITERRIWGQDQSVVVGGDMNSHPHEAAMDSMYYLNRAGEYEGPGNFYEADQSDPKNFDTRPKGVACAPHGCRTGASTMDDTKVEGTKKYDYVFFSRNRVRNGVSAMPMRFGAKGCDPDADPGKDNCSDHRLYRAYGDFRF